MLKRSSDGTSKMVIIAGVVMAILATLIVMLDLEPLRQLDRMSYDMMLRRLGEIPANPRVLVIDVDEESLARYGQWPWPRHLVARMLDAVRDGKPDSVAIDILFAEPDRTSLGLLSTELKSDFGLELDITHFPPETLDHDGVLARTLQSGPFSLSVMFLFREEAKKEVELPDNRLRIVRVNRSKGEFPPFSVAEGVVTTIPLLAMAADGLGFVNVLPDQDGVIRRAPLLIQYGDTLYPSLALLACMRAQQSNTVVLESAREGITSIHAGDSSIPVDRQGNILVRFRGPSQTYASISAAAVLDGKIPPDTFNNKVIFIGASAEGLTDKHPTPFDRHFPGVQIHASVASSILDQDFITVPIWTVGAKGLGAFLAVLLSLATVIRLSTWAAGSILFGFLFIIPMGAMALFDSQRIFISPASSMVVYIISFALLALARFRSEEILDMRRERELATAKDCAMVGLASLAETRDTETGRHILRTQRYIQALAEYLTQQSNRAFQFQPKDIDLLVKSTPLHDVGKVGVPDSILLKPGRLTPSEFEEMKKHTLYGAETLAKAELISGITDEASFLKTAREIALSHHEKWDGTGYPNKLKGEDIPQSGRLMALADVYDALISERVYKKAMSHEKAAKIIRDGRGIHFDPKIVAAFEALELEFRAIARETPDEEQ